MFPSFQVLPAVGFSSNFGVVARVPGVTLSYQRVTQDRLTQLAERGCRQTSFSPLGQLRPGQGWSEVAREKDVTWFWRGWDGSDRPYALKKKRDM